MEDTANRSVRILVVDAEASSGRELCEALYQGGYTAEYSVSAARAYAMARRSTPAVMIVDIALDTCTGYEFAKTVRAEYPDQDIPVIFISKDARGRDAIEKSRSAGGMYFLCKPIDISVLLELVDKSLWMPHLVQRHIENSAHPAHPKTPRLLASDVYAR